MGRSSGKARTDSVAGTSSKERPFMLIVIHSAIQSNNEFHIFGNLWELCRSPASLLHHLVEISKRLPAALDSYFLPTCHCRFLLI